MKKITALLSLALGFGLSAAGQSLVKDMIPGSNDGNPDELASLGNVVLFKAQDPNLVFGDYNLWRTAGTTAGTMLVKAIKLNGSGGNPLVRLGGYLYFNADDGINGYELWKTDGTTAGTVLVKNICPNTYYDGPSNLTVMNGRLYFQANDGVVGSELWVSDGTAAGTTLVKDIRPGIQPGLDASTSNTFAVVNGNLFFRAWDGLTGYELWKSNGTAAGTVLVKDLVPGNTSIYPEYMTACNGKVYFTGNDQVLGRELYVSDGTAAGTTLLKDIEVGQLSSGPGNFAALGNTLYFTASTTTAGREVWKTTGTAASTVMVKDVNPGTSSGYPLTNGNSILTPYNGNLYYVGFDGTDTRLYRTDGTSAGTVSVNAVNATTRLITISDPVVVDGLMYFGASNYVQSTRTGVEPWLSDGTTAGTHYLGDLNPGYFSSSPYWFIACNGAVLFAATTNNTGRELWRYNATATGVSSAATSLLPTPWPNPVADRLHLPASELPGPVRYTVRNALGQEVLRGQAPAGGILEVSQLPAGMYFLSQQPGTLPDWRFIKE